MRSDEQVRVEKQLHDLYTMLRSLAYITGDISHMHKAEGVQMAAQSLEIKIPIQQKEQKYD